MNYLDLQQRAAYLASRPGYIEAAPAPDWGSLVNGALADYTWDTEINVENAQVTTVVNQAEYTLDASASPRMWKYLFDCAYGTDTALVETTEQTERSRDPLWLVRPAGVPDRYYLSGPNRLRLVPAPSTPGVV